MYTQCGCTLVSTLGTGVALAFNGSVSFCNHYLDAEYFVRGGRVISLWQLDKVVPCHGFLSDREEDSFLDGDHIVVAEHRPALLLLIY